MNTREKVCYETDISRIIGKAEKIYFPENAEEVKEIIRKNNNLTLRGAGTGFSGGVIPENSAVIDVSYMNSVTNFNASKRTVKVGAGITLKELNEKLNAVGYEFPIIPANNGISTIGGMIATNADGKRSMKYGNMKEWIEEIEFIDGKGDLIRTSKADLSDVCGMEGITGVIVSASLKVRPLVKRSISVFQSNNINEVLSVARSLKQEKEITMIVFLSPVVSEMLGFPKKYYLIVEFDSLRGKVSGEEYEKLSRIKERAYFILFSNGYYNSEDPRLFFDTVKEFVSFLEEQNIPYFGDLGTGVIYPFFKDFEKAKRAEIIELIKKMKLKFGRYGYGLTRKNLLDSFDAKLIQRVKLRHDPEEKLNKKKVLDISGKVSDVYRERPLYSEKSKEERLDERKIVKIERKEINSDSKKEFELIEEARKELDEKGVKSPDEKLRDFIKEVEIIDNVERGIENKSMKEDIMEVEKSAVKEEIKEKLMDYRQTFESEMEPEKLKAVENYAKEIPKDIISEPGIRKQKSLVDYNLIKNIMTNNKSLFAGAKGLGEKPESPDIETGKVIVTDNLDRNVEKKDTISSSERDIINRILGNRYKENKNEGGNQ